MVPIPAVWVAFSGAPDSACAVGFRRLGRTFMRFKCHWGSVCRQFSNFDRLCPLTPSAAEHVSPDEQTRNGATEEQDRTNRPTDPIGFGITLDSVYTKLGRRNDRVRYPTGVPKVIDRGDIGVGPRPPDTSR